MSEKGRKWIKIGKKERRGGKRSGNVGNIDELWKRKREEMEKGKDKKEEEEWAFKSEKKVQRSPQKIIMMESGKGEERMGWEGIKEDWKKEMKEILREVKNKLMEERARKRDKGGTREIKKTAEGEGGEMGKRENEYGRIGELEKRLEELKVGEEMKIREGEGKGGEIESRIRRMERKLERREREERRKM